VQNIAIKAVMKLMYRSFLPVSHMNIKAHGFMAYREDPVNHPGDHRIPVGSHKENIKAIGHRAG